jgi:acetyl-CoA carboxylase biotin carboxyl carrier protein
MEMSEIEQLIELMNRSNLRELTVRQGDSRITVKKSPFENAIDVGSDLVPYKAQIEGADAVAHTIAYDGSTGILEAADDVEAVTAPLVGIFHHVKPLIGPGTTVTAGQVVAVIEAMNLITEVTSPVSGTVLETVIKDGMPSEYGQTLFLVKAQC